MNFSSGSQHGWLGSEDKQIKRFGGPRNGTAGDNPWQGTSYQWADEEPALSSSISETDHSMKAMLNLMSYGCSYCSPLQNVILSARVMGRIVSSPNSHVGVVAPWNLRMWTISLFGNGVFMEVIE